MHPAAETKTKRPRLALARSAHLDQLDRPAASAAVENPGWAGVLLEFEGKKPASASK